MAATFTRSSRAIQKLSKSTEPLSTSLSPLDLIDRSLETICETVDQRFDAVDQRFDAVDQRFDAVDQRFDVVDQRFDAVDQRFVAVDERFDAVDQRFDAVDQRFVAVDERFDAVDQQLAILKHNYEQDRRRGFNYLSVTARATIQQLGIYDEAEDFLTPKYFPPTVRHFWKLKLPEKCESYFSHLATMLIRAIVGTLVYLVKFYGIKGHQYWVEEDHNAESDESSQHRPSMENAVRLNPDDALRALAGHLGLNYEQISKNMKKMDNFWHADRRPAAKHGRHDSKDSAEPVKRRRPSPGHEDETGSSQGQDPGPKPSVPLDVLVHKRTSTPSTRNSEQSRVMWDSTIPIPFRQVSESHRESEESSDDSIQPRAHPSAQHEQRETLTVRGVPGSGSRGREGSSSSQKTLHLDPKFYEAMDSPSSQES